MIAVKYFQPEVYRTDKKQKKEEVAEAYMAEFAKCNEAMMNELVKECESIMAGPAQPGQA